MTSSTRSFTLGDMALLYEPGVVRRITKSGIEVVRLINAPVRDQNWATSEPTLVDSVVEETDGRLTIEEHFTVLDGAMEGYLTFTIEAVGRLTATLSLIAKRDVVTNRAGFTLLHPIASVAGTDLTLRHSDGSHETVQFPDRIAPGQPALDIVGLLHIIGSVAVDITFDGEIFEMEDQRNWSDASFKTYCRPLTLPTPYTVAAGETVRQTITVELEAHRSSRRQEGPAGATRTVAMPTIGLAVEPDWMGPVPTYTTPVLRFDGADKWDSNDLQTIARSHSDVDVEVIVPEDADAGTVLQSIKDCLDAAGLHAAHAITLPAAYLKSYQPSGPWPTGLSPADCARATRQVFPQSRIGVGMLTHFTEFNRCPPDVALGDYVTFANTAIVHAADDLSVWETLEALPDILASARYIAGDLPIRLGLVSIGMRTNPYGAALAPNPHARRLAMTGDDPRQDGVFSAAYAVAAFALAADAGVEAITLAAPAGRFGLVRTDGSPRPMARAVQALAALEDHAKLDRDTDMICLQSSAGRVTVRTSQGGRLEIEGLEASDV